LISELGGARVVRRVVMMCVRGMAREHVYLYNEDRRGGGGAHLRQRELTLARMATWLGDACKMHT
jgi:rRNA processing protein Krr1/Pno1